MTTISSFDDLDTDLPTREQVLKIIARIHLKIAMIVSDTNVYAGAPYQENGDTGFSVNPTAMLAELRQQLEMYNKALSDPDTFDSLFMYITKHDNANL